MLYKCDICEKELRTKSGLRGHKRNLHPEQSDNTAYPCPKGCEREFRTNSAAYAHARHCKYEAPAGVELGQEPDPEPDPPELDPPEQAILERLTRTVVAEIEQGIVGLQERVQANIVASFQEALPQMVANEVQGIVSKFTEGAKGNSGNPGSPGNPKTDSMAIFNQINTLLETPLGRLIQNKLLGGSSSRKRKENIDDWRRGTNLAIRMLGANKSDTDATAAMIKELAGPYKGKAGHDLYRGMYNAAEMFKPAQKGGPVPSGEPTKLNVQGGEKTE